MANQDTATLPIIDYAKIIGPSISDTPEALAASVAEKTKLYNAFATVGFIYLTNHAVPAFAEQNLFAHARKFFALPESEKAKVETGESKGFRGWFNPARTSGNKATSDEKETFDVGNDADEKRPNQWPENWPELREDMNLVFERCCEVQLVLLGALAEHVGVTSDYFEPRMSSKDHFFRIIHYPGRARNPANTRYRATPHTDYGTLTLLFNDSQGGLQVKNSEGQWVDAEPIPGCCIVNGKIPDCMNPGWRLTSVLLVGDLLARWFNDKLESTEHRVVDPSSSEEQISARYAIAWFGQPNRDTVVEPLEPCCTPENPKKYPAVEAGKHVMERLADLQKRGRNREAWKDEMSRGIAVKVE